MTETETTAANAVKLTSKAVGANVARLRGMDRCSASRLAGLLRLRGLPMSTSGIQDIEHGRRTVSVDQLTALADALDVSPITLLMPHSLTGESEMVSLTGTRPVGGRALWNYLRAEPSSEAARRRSTPPWAWNVGATP